ncbi:DNA methyltransferase [Holdemanella biformis]|uniref:DNA methyltransferase n=1 Tax=Holdemanella biformis TaxID=1735 RepID=UPI0026DB75B1|nr:DNA methyltransferase [Holdemanella biformis]
MNEQILENTHLYCGEALDFYDRWETPTVIVCDGPYGVKGFPGDLVSHEGLGEWYEPHIKKWSELATPLTTLWFWNTEVGWATVHPILEKYGWAYVSCCIWDKGMSHVAGNTNTKTIRHLPVVTEVCVQYVKKPAFKVGNESMSMKEWLRFEWQRTKLPFRLTNEACGVKNAATRKYFTKCHLWYMPPAEAFEKIAEYANNYGDESGKPYFSIDGEKPISKVEWARMRSKFYCPIGITNVWQVPQLRNSERLKANQKAIHLNQKPLVLIKRIIEMASDKGDVIWDPFAGLCTSAIASIDLERVCYCAEINPDVYDIAVKRVKSHLDNGTQCSF